MALFKELLRESPLVRYSIYAAGVGGIAETIHNLWLFGVWAYWKLK